MVNVFVKFEAFDALCDKTIEEWKIDRPGEMAVFARQIRDERELSEDVRHFSGDTFLRVAELPAYLVNVINIKYPDWMLKKDYRDRFLRRYPELRMDPTKFTGTTQGFGEKS